MKKKMNFVIFRDFSNFWKKIDNNNYNEKKKILGKNRFWATAQLYCEKEKNLCCKARFVLQLKGA